MSSPPGARVGSPKEKALQTQGLRSEADGTRTRNHRIDSQPDESRNQRRVADLRNASEVAAAPIAAPAADRDLARLIAAWDGLPRAVRAGINAMVAAATAADRGGPGG